MDSKKLARVAGVFYLIIIVCGLFSEGFVRMSLVVPGDALQTATNIQNSEFLFRLGFVSDLIMVISDIIVAILFFYILKPVNQMIASFAIVFRLAQASVIAMNLLNHLSPLLLLSVYSDGAWETAQVSEQILLFMQGHKHGYLISQVLFGFNCASMAYLIIKSNLFPRILGIGIGITALAYLVDALINFLSPTYSSKFEMMMIIPALVEISFCLWLLIKGVKGNEIQA